MDKPKPLLKLLLYFYNFSCGKKLKHHSHDSDIWLLFRRRRRRCCFNRTRSGWPHTKQTPGLLYSLHTSCFLKEDSNLAFSHGPLPRPDSDSAPFSCHPSTKDHCPVPTLLFPSVGADTELCSNRITRGMTLTPPHQPESEKQTRCGLRVPD